MFIQNVIKIHPFVLKILRKNTFLHQSRVMIVLFIYEFSQFAIPNHSSPISMSMQNLKKIGQKLLKLKSPETKRWRTDGRSKWFGGYNIIPRHFLWRGIKVWKHIHCTYQGTLLHTTLLFTERREGNACNTRVTFEKNLSKSATFWKYNKYYSSNFILNLNKFFNRN